MNVKISVFMVHQKISQKISNCFINNISFLKKARFNFIKNINLSLNNIGNEIIDILFKLNFPYLEEFNLFKNNFTDYNFFKFKNENKSYDNLKTLYIGSNVFKENFNNEDIYDLSSIQTIGLSKGVFDNDTIIMINNFNLKNIENLYLGNNNLNNLSFINKLELPEVKKIVLDSNSLENFENLKKYKNTNQY